MTLLVTYLLLAVGVSFLCSILEAVLLSVTPSYIESLKASRPGTSARLQQLKENVDKPLAAILTLNTISHTVGAAGVGSQSAVVFGSAWLGVTSAVLTLLILVFSEIIPKTIGARYWRQMAPKTARPLQWMIRVLAPFIWLSDRITSMVGKKEMDDTAHIRDEIKAMASIGNEAGELAEAEYGMLKNLLAFRDTRLDKIMTPRMVIHSVPETMTVSDYICEHSQSPFSRVLLYRGDDKDEITGYTHKHDILLSQQTGDPVHTTLGQLVKPLIAAPQTMSVPQLFSTMLQRREHIALVVSEYGDVQGLVTLEDMLETVLGMEIVDETDVHVDLQQVARDKRADLNETLEDVLVDEETLQGQQTPAGSSDEPESKDNPEQQPAAERKKKAEK